MKGSKGIVGLFLALFVLISGVCVGDDSGDILDFLPAFAKRAKFGNAVAKPFFIVPGVSTPVTINAYIPDADLVADSVQLKDGTAIIGNLSDTGNKVFSLTHNFQRDNGGAIKLSIAATFGTVNKTIAQFEITVLSLPTLQDASQYNQNIDNMFSTLVTTKDNFSVLQNPATTSEQSSIHLGLARERLLSVYANMEAIYRAETHSPSNFPRWTAFVPTYGGLLGSADSILSDRELFKKNPHDPRVANILAWAQSTFPWDTYLSTPADRETAAWYYQTHGPNAPLQGTLKEANKVAIKQAGGQFTGLAGTAIGQLFGGVTGWLVKKAFNASVDKIVDISISNNNEMGLLVGQVQDDEAVQVPAGSHDVLFSFGGILGRAIGRNILINPYSSFTVSISPGEIKGYPTAKFSYYNLGLGRLSSALGINDKGVIVGSYVSGDYYRPFRLENGVMEDLGTLGGPRAGAIGINNNGQIVGCSDTSDNSINDGTINAFLWAEGDGIKNLGTLGGKDSQAYAINNNGQVVGYTNTVIGPNPIFKPFLWTQLDGMKSLDGQGLAYGINNLGQIIGQSSFDGNPKAFLWSQATGMTLLGPVGNYGHGAHGINDFGTIVGYGSNLYMTSWFPCLWNGSVEIQNLGTLGGRNYSMALAINNNFKVVGYSSSFSDYDNNHAFLWTETEGIQDLNSLVVNLPMGVILIGAQSINNLGQIVGVGTEGAFLLNPIE